MSMYDYYSAGLRGDTEMILSGLKYSSNASGAIVSEALQGAAGAGQVATIEAVISAGWSIDYPWKSKTPLMAALAVGNDTMGCILIDMGANSLAQDVLGLTTLHHCVYGCNPECVHLIIAAGIPVDASDNEGRTPLLLAAKKGSIGVIDALLFHGADIHKRDHSGKGAVDYALERKSRRPLAFLLERGADPPNGEVMDFEPPLHL